MTEKSTLEIDYFFKFMNAKNIFSIFSSKRFDVMKCRIGRPCSATVCSENRVSKKKKSRKSITQEFDGNRYRETPCTHDVRLYGCIRNIRVGVNAKILVVSCSLIQSGIPRCLLTTREINRSQHDTLNHSINYSAPV